MTGLERCGYYAMHASSDQVLHHGKSLPRFCYGFENVSDSTINIDVERDNTEAREIEHATRNRFPLVISICISIGALEYRSGG